MGWGNRVVALLLITNVRCTQGDIINHIIFKGGKGECEGSYKTIRRNS